MCPTQVSIDNHALTIIGSDVGDVEPKEVDSFVIYAGERFDFVVHANGSGTNIMRFGGHLDCSILKTRGKALLVYDKEDVEDNMIEQVSVMDDYESFVPKYWQDIKSCELCSS